MSFNFKDKFRGTVSIIGASEIDEKTRQVAIELGRLLARNNYAVSCGGLSGVMEAVCKGAKEEGGLTIGLIPFKDKNRANEYVDIVIPGPFSQARNVVVVLSGDVCVAVAGKAGTLSEICFAWIYEKPIIGLTCVEGWSSKMAGQQLDDRRTDKIHGAYTPEDIIIILNEIFTQNKFNPITNI